MNNQHSKTSSNEGKDLSVESSASPRPVQEQDLPMSYADYLLSHLAQECCEIAIRCTKAQHFGLDEIQPEQSLTNRQRIQEELCDLYALVDEMQESEILNAFSRRDYQARISAKLRKAAAFRDYSRDLGRLAAVNVPRARSGDPNR